MIDNTLQVRVRSVARTVALLAGSMILPIAAVAQRSPGVAVVRVGDNEYTIPIECDDASRPEVGFSTEPSRVTRERTGRTSGVNLRLRIWQDTNLVIVSLDRYVTWMPRPSSSAGVLTLEISLSPMSVPRDRAPVAYTFEMWNSGDRPFGIEGVTFEARCGLAEPVTPSVRRIGSP